MTLRHAKQRSRLGNALMTKRNWRRLMIASALVAAGSALAVPAGAQFLNGRAGVGAPLRPQQAQFRDFFPFQWWGGERGGRYDPWFGRPTPPPADYSKAPPPRKLETPPTTTVLVLGDSLADWLGYGLEEALADTPEVGVVRKIKGTSGLIRYEARSETPDWAQVAKDILATEKPNAIVVMLGLNDRQSLRERAPSRPTAQPNQQAAQPNQAATQPSQTQPSGHDDTAPAAPGAEAPADPPAAPPAETQQQRRTPAVSYEFHTDKWGELYSKRVDEMIAVLKTKGVPVLWVGLPALRGPRSTTDVTYLDEIYRARAEKAGIPYVDVWDGFVDDAGRFTMQGPDFEGQIRKLRSADGVHFTKPGAVKLGYYVERELRRVLSSHVLPVALPGPEQSPAKGGARPAIGPVVPLGAIGAGEGTDLLGGGASHPSQAASDPLVIRVLSRGEAIAPPPGRADDFSWPRGAAGAAAAAPNAGGASSAGAAPSGGASAEVEPPAAAAAPASPQAQPTSPQAQPAKSPAGKIEAKKPGDAKPNEAKPNEVRPGEAKTGEAKTSDAKASEAKVQPGPDAPPPAPPKPRRPRVYLDGAPRPPLPVGPR
jgi:uncharacterized protein